MNPIEVNGLSKSYGKVPAIDDFSFTVGPRELVALAGPDGAGKTSLFRSICGLIEFDRGDIRVAGHDVRTDFDSIKPRLGYMPQTFSLYPDLSVEENLRFYAGIFGMNRREFEDKKRSLYGFSGLGRFSNRRAEHLSGGMKQKLALSCNLIHDPDVLVLDEPTTWVDPLSRKQFWDILQGLRDRGASIVVSTPYMDELGLADRAVLMNMGRKLAEGTPADLVGGYKGKVFMVPGVPSTAEMRQLERVAGVTGRRYGASIRVYVPEGAQSSGVARLVADAGIDAAGLEEIEPELEDVFVQLMGSEDE
jgi:ABC-type multidrug transport system ATPase subunit